MDKQEIMALSNMLYAELCIGAVLYKSQSSMTIPQIKSNEHLSKYSEQYIHGLLKDLISRGIVETQINTESIFVFSITEFGKYYYKELLKSDSSYPALLKIGGDLF